MGRKAGSGFLLVSLSLLLIPHAPVRAQSPPSKRASVLPAALLAFEPNVGQADKSVKYVARAGGYTVALTTDGPVLGLDGDVVRMRWTGGSRAKLTASDELPGKANYLVGDRSRWKRNVP